MNTSHRTHSRKERIVGGLRRAALGLTIAMGGAATSIAQNLLTNPSFEQGMTGWSVVSGAAVDRSYGSSEVASVAVATQIGGGNRLLRHTSGSTAAVEQMVQVGTVPPGTNLYARGFFGGWSTTPDRARLVIRFLNAGGSEIALRNLEYVTRESRNNESVLMVREGMFAIPAGTDKIVARVELEVLQCCGAWATADLIHLELTTASVIPPPLPLDAELLVNPGFESGWSATSPLTLIHAQGWEGTAGQTVTRTYSNANPDVPSLTVSSIVSGQGKLLGHAAANAAIRQSFDVRGNAGQIANGLALDVRAFMGGVGSLGDHARVEVEFLDANGSRVGMPPPPLGPVTSQERNSETVVMLRASRLLIPAGTERINVNVHFQDGTCCQDGGLLDNVSAVLRVPTSPAPLPLNVNLVHNGSFEQGSLSGSPLVLTDPNSWIGTLPTPVVVKAYGSGVEVPTTTFATSNGLGGLVASHLNGHAGLRKTFSLAGYEAEIALGTLALDASVWLGGHSSLADDARLTITFRNANGVQVGPLEILGPVTPADRMNLTTLISKSASVLVPQTATSFVIDALFNNNSCCSGWGLFDDARVILSVQGSPYTTYCTSKPTSIPGCLPAIGASGAPSASAGSGFVLTGGPVPGANIGIFFYGHAGAGLPTTTPFGDICIQTASGIFRSTPVFGGGSTGTCTGSYSLDWNTYALLPATVQADPLSSVPGTTVDGQFWYRDPPNPGAANLTDAISFTIGT